MTNHIYAELENRGYRVYRDTNVPSIDDFRKEIAKAVPKCDLFVLVVTADSIERFRNEGDISLYEVELAMDSEVPLVIITCIGIEETLEQLNGEGLPESVGELAKKNIVEYRELYENLAIEFLVKAISDIKKEKTKDVEDSERVFGNVSVWGKWGFNGEVIGDEYEIRYKDGVRYVGEIRVSDNGLEVYRHGVGSLFAELGGSSYKFECEWEDDRLSRQMNYSKSSGDSESKICEVKYKKDNMSSNYQVEILNITGERTVAEFVFKPLNNFSRAFDLNFDGDLIELLLHGRGQMWDENNVYIYQGEFKNNLPDGEGILFNPNGGVQYLGFFKEGKPNGAGKFYDGNNEVIYEGVVKEGLCDGLGVQYENRMIGYMGMWQRGKKNGKGMSYDKGVLEYEGDFQENKFCGYGTKYFRNGKVEYSGNWDKDKYSGRGILYDFKGDVIYEGDFEEGKFHGYGTQYKNGEIVCKGYFEKNRFKG